VDLSNFINALTAWVSTNGRLDIPLDVKIGDNTLPESLKQAVAPALKELEPLIGDIPDAEKARWAAPVILEVAHYADKILGVPHAYQIFTTQDDIALYLEHPTDIDRKMTELIRSNLKNPTETTSKGILETLEDMAAGPHHHLPESTRSNLRLMLSQAMTALGNDEPSTTHTILYCIRLFTGPCPVGSYEHTLNTYLLEAMALLEDPPLGRLNPHDAKTCLDHLRAAHDVLY
jgi:hypothetical protein